MSGSKGTIGILTGGGDVPGLNPAIRGVTMRAIREGYQVIGLRRGWAGIVEMVRDKDYDNSNNFIPLTEQVVSRAARTGGTFIHTSRTRPSHLPKSAVPPHLADKYTADTNDMTPEVLKNLEWLGINYLIPIGGDDTLSYGLRVHQEGFPTVAIPKTMDNDVPGTDYCIGFSTCITRTVELANMLRTVAGSHERIMVIEVMGRYAGFTALLPTMAGAADRCVIPEHPFDVERLTELLMHDRKKNPSNYSVVLVSEGAVMTGDSDMKFEGEEADQFGHKKLGGIGDAVAERVKKLSARYNNGHQVNIVNQRMGYLVRCGEPDAIDSLAPMAFGNLALDLIKEGNTGRLVCVRNGTYDSIPLSEISGKKKVVDVERFYNTSRLRPVYEAFHKAPLFFMSGGI